MKLSDREWKDFSVPYIFQKIQRGKRLKNADHISGIIPYVSSTANNNGVDDYIEAIDGTRVFENCISLANSGSVGTAFYEPFAFVASDHVTSLKRENTSQYVYLFLTAVLEQQGSNFNFNREINDLRIRKMRVMLPVDDNDEPDYQFMEDYMKELMTAKRKQYQEYVEQRLVKLGVDDMKNTERGGYNLDLESREWKPCRLSKLGKVESGRDIYAMERVEGDTLIIYELDRLARDKKAISNELRYYDEHNIRVMILDIPTTTTDLPDTDAMNKLIVETINKVIIDVYAMLAETELQRKTKRQQEGLIAMKERGEWDNYGRHRVMSLPDFEKEYQNVKDGKIKSLELMRKLNMKKSTYFKYVREIKLMNSTD